MLAHVRSSLPTAGLPVIVLTGTTDPDAEVHQFYTQSKKSGGFLRITVGPGKKPSTGSARFTFMDDLGNVLYETEKVRPAKN